MWGVGWGLEGRDLIDVPQIFQLWTAEVIQSRTN